MIPYGRQSLTEDDIAAVVAVLKSDFLTQGPQVELFEKNFAEYVGAPFAVAVANGTAALHLAAMALQVAPGDRVLVTPNTFVASANCIRFCGGDVEFVDIDPNTFCMDISKLEAKLQSKPRGYYRGLVAVDFAGYAMDFEPIRKLANDHKLWIIEDACHALGAEMQDASLTWQRVGNCKYSDVAVFSFHPVKHLATGEGGMITTRSPELYEKLKLLRTHGITRDPKALMKNDGGWYYEMQELGYNYRMPDILCALGTSQLKRMDHNIETRRQIAERYFNELASLPIELPRVPENMRHGYHLFVIQTENRKTLYDFLRGKGVFTQVHYIPVHLQPYYIECYGQQSLTIVEKYYQHALSIPMYHSLTSADQKTVIESIKNFFR
jgi:UDP-4-amino-4,6-dideoxy-N-acetyl-beta-L-altrosamine transaminase